MKSILIAGATGLVGGHVLELALQHPLIRHVVAPTRRPLPQHEKLDNPICDFSNLPQDADWWAVDGVVCTLGTTRAKAGSADAFRAVDFDMQHRIAQITKAHGAERFALTSSVGANPKSWFFYLRTKGELEEAVARLKWLSFTVVRPGQLLGERKETRLSERMSLSLVRTLAPVLPTTLRGSPARKVASSLLKGAVDGAPGKHLVNSSQLA